MRDKTKNTGRSYTWRKLVAAFVAFATLLAMVVVSGVAGSAYADDSSRSLNDYVTGVTLKKAPKGSDNWSDFDGTLEENEQLRVAFNFEIPKGTLGTDKNSRTFVYDSPVGITTSDATEDHPGHFSSIDAEYYFKDGKIYVIFSEKVAEQNAEHPITNGTFYFMSDADHVGGGNNGEFDFGNSHKETIIVNHRGDLAVEKTHAEPSADGTVTWTVKVSSKSGTKPGEAIDITDIPSLGTIDMGSIHVDGGDCAPKASGNGFTMSCPALDENGTYTITYISKVDVKDGEITSQKNDVTVKAKDKNGNELNKSASNNVSWDKKPSVSKSNGVLNADGSATWTVTVDASKLNNLDGWKLDDQVTKGKLSGTIKVKPAVNGQTEFSSFPIAFGANDAKTTYTFTYTTTPDAGVGAAEVKNSANLTPPNGGTMIPTGEKGIDPGAYNPLSKTHGTVEPSADGKTAIVPWTVTIAPKTAAEALPAGWTFTDSLSQNQYLDDSQRSALETAIKTAFMRAGLSEPTITFTKDWQQRTSGFTITSKDALGVGKSIAFSYNATGTIAQSWSGEQYYSNTVNASGFTARNDVTYSPSNLKWTINKIDAKTGSGADSEHEYNDSSSMEQVDDKPVMHWQVKVNQTDAIKDTDIYTDLIITEQLPQGVTLLDADGLDVNIDGGNSKCSTKLTVPNVGGTSQSTCSWSIWDNTHQEIFGSGTITVSQDTAGVIKVTVPGELMRQLRTVTYSDSQKISITLDVRATIDDSSALGKTATVFKNTAQLSDATGKDWGEKSQSQKITKDDEWNVISKKTSYSSNSNDNLVPYSIVVNPNALDLDPKSGTITLEDRFSYPYDEQNPVEFSLQGVKVYKYVNGARGDELPTTDYTVTPASSSSGNKRINELKLTLPDSKALVVEYSYKVIGTPNTGVTVSNSASLKGKTSGVNGTSVKVAESHGDATVSVVTFTKVDSNHLDTTLPDAVFDLYKWDSSSKTWAKLCTGLKTDENGQLTFSAGTTDTNECSENQNKVCDLSGANIRFNVAYKLVETQAPSGYDTPTGTAAVHYFMLRNVKDESRYPLSKPDDFPSDAIHNSGYSGLILNDRSKASLPSTGGMGDGWFVAGGALTVLVACFGLAETRKNAKRGKSLQL